MKTLASLFRISLLMVLVGVLCCAHVALGQTETGTVSGLITDESGAAVPGAEVHLLSVQRGTTADAKTNGAGIYVFASVQPGQYQIKVQKPGFKQVDLLSLIVNVQDHIEQNVRLQIGSVSESVTVNAEALHMNTTDATVSTVIDRNFAENLPMNGRSFQTLIQLTPGVVSTQSNPNDGGQFSVNGQRAASNYWMVDGVSANIGLGVNPAGFPGNGIGGALGSFSVLGGTNSLVSVDAMQEFRIQTSTYAPEFGRTPGAQISIVTRSGTNSFHGALFDYFRNGALDANDWFAGAHNLPKPEERQNDFGGTFSGPLLKNRTFFFFSYEGLRLRLPQTTLTTVPNLLARQSAVPAMQPYLNAYPIPNGAELGNGIAEFNASYSNPAKLDAYSLRIDHRLGDKIILFGRYNYSPSESIQRGGGAGYSLNTISPTSITTQTGTVGITFVASPNTTNDLRFNYSRTNASSHFNIDNFGGAVPLTSLPFPTPFTAQNANFLLVIAPLQDGLLQVGQFERNVQRQINIVDSLSVQRGAHGLKFGVDFRRLSPIQSPAAYSQSPFFDDVPSAETGNQSFSLLQSNLSPIFLFRNLGIYGQDTWRLAARLTLTYGFRWDIDFSPRSLNGLNFPAVTGFDLNNFANLDLAPLGTPPYKTGYHNFAPRVGAAYLLNREQEWQTVFRGGFGIFYDLASSEAGNQLRGGSYPFGALSFPSGTFPFDPATAAAPAITPPSATNPAFLLAFDPGLRLPYTLEWNFALEQAVGKQQTISASYIGATGKRLLQSAFIISPSPIFSDVQLVSNPGNSSYNALQLQFQRRLSRGFQALVSHTWSHSIDTASAGSIGNATNALVPVLATNANRGPSDFDIRQAFSAGLTYEIPAPNSNRLTATLLRSWSLQSVIQARSAPPVDISDATFFLLNGDFLADIRPDLVAGQPLYVRGSQCISTFGFPCPGGRGLNPAAFAHPPVDPSTGDPLRQGNVPRNFLRGFGATQWDFAVHRDFSIHESLKLLFRAEMFNVLNHPNFGPPSGQFGTGGFGVSNQMLGRSLNNQNQGGGGFDALYQVGGPRSIQLALKLQF